MSFQSIWDTDSEPDLPPDREVRMSSPSSSQIKLHKKVIDGCRGASFPGPNKVQLQALRYFMGDYIDNILICAPPRSGKTSSAVLAILDSFSKTSDEYSLAILLGPTYETAGAAYSCCEKLARFCNVSLYFASKGKCLSRDKKRPKEIFIGTPEKILELNRSNVIQLKKASFLLIDEADCLGNPRKYFLDSYLIYQELPKKCRIIVCTTSKTEALNDFMEKRILHHTEVNVKEVFVTKFPIHKMYLVYHDEEDKVKSLSYIINMKQFSGQVVIFCETKETVEELAEQLHCRNIPSIILIGKLPIAQKKNILEEFHNKTYKILITTRSFVSVIPENITTKLIHYDKVLNSKHEFDRDTYQKREYLLSKTDKCLEVHFVEKKWTDYLFKQKDIKSGKSSFKGIVIVSSEELETYFFNFFFINMNTLFQTI